MKNNFAGLLFIFAAFNFILIGATKNYAQTEMKEPIVGGYNSVETTNAQVVRAANFAVKAQAKKQKAKIKLVAIRKAEQQVVAGMNYNLCLQVETKEKGKKAAVPQTVQTVVFLNLKQKHELESWAIAACADEIPPVVPVK